MVPLGNGEFIAAPHSLLGSRAAPDHRYQHVAISERCCNPAKESSQQVLQPTAEEWNIQQPIVADTPDQ